MMPALNEEDSIAETIGRIPLDELKTKGYESDILIVDGGSTDKTVEISRKCGAGIIKTRRGYGWQYRIGFEAAEGEIIVTADSDCSYPMESIPEFLEMLEKEKLEFITTNRFAFMKKGSMALPNKIGNKVLTLFANFLFNLNLKDSQSGMWIIRKEALKKIKLESLGMPLSQEIKIEAFAKLKAMEVGSTYNKRVGKVKLRMFQNGWDNLKHLFKKKFLG